MLNIFTAIGHQFEYVFGVLRDLVFNRPPANAIDVILQAETMARDATSPDTTSVSERSVTPATIESYLSEGSETQGGPRDLASRSTIPLDEGRSLSPELTAIETLRQLRQELSDHLKQLIGILHKNQSAHAVDSHQFSYFTALIEQLQYSHKASLALRKKLKKLSAEDISLTTASSNTKAVLPVHLQLLHCHSLIARMEEQAPALSANQEDIEAMIAAIAIPHPTINQLLALKIQPLNLPVATRLLNFFSERADLFAFGTILSLPLPADIDLTMHWNIPTDTLHDIKDAVVTKLQEEGFQLARDPMVMMDMDRVVITLRAKGDGYDTDNHKRIDLIILGPNHKDRIKDLPKNSYSACSLNIRTGELICNEADARAMIDGLFSLRTFEYSSPIITHNAKVHNLNTLMRAWYESRISELRLDEESLRLIAEIQSYKGNWGTLRGKDLALFNVLEMVIIKHFSHFNDSETFKRRTNILIEFFVHLRNNAEESAVVALKEFIQRSAAKALKTVIAAELYDCHPKNRVLATSEAYLSYCQKSGLPISEILKESLLNIVKMHFAHFEEGEDYLQKTSLLLNFCNKLNLKLFAIKGTPASTSYLQLLSVDLRNKIIDFAEPLSNIEYLEPTLRFEPSPQLFQTNNRMKFQAISRRIKQERSASLTSSDKTHSPESLSPPPKDPSVERRRAYDHHLFGLPPPSVASSAAGTAFSSPLSFS